MIVRVQMSSVSVIIMIVKNNLYVCEVCWKKSKSYYSFGMVQNVDGDEVSATFLKQSLRYSVDGKSIFTFKENNEGIFSRGDVLRKLPKPQILGGTARREQYHPVACSVAEENYIWNSDIRFSGVLIA